MTSQTVNPPELNTMRIEIDGEIGTLTLDRPDAFNAMSPEMIGEMTVAFAWLADRAPLRALIVTGAGKASAPAATSLVPQGVEDEEIDLPSEVRRGAEALHQAIVDLRRIPYPVIAAINGRPSAQAKKAASEAILMSQASASEKPASGDVDRGDHRVGDPAQVDDRLVQDLGPAAHVGGEIELIRFDPFAEPVGHVAAAQNALPAPVHGISARDGALSASQAKATVISPIISGLIALKASGRVEGEGADLAVDLGIRIVFSSSRLTVWLVLAAPCWRRFSIPWFLSHRMRG